MVMSLHSCNGVFTSSRGAPQTGKSGGFRWTAVDVNARPSNLLSIASIKDMNFQLRYFISPIRDVMQYSSFLSMCHQVSTTVATHQDELSSTSPHPLSRDFLKLFFQSLKEQKFYTAACPRTKQGMSFCVLIWLATAPNQGHMIRLLQRVESSILPLFLWRLKK